MCIQDPPQKNLARVLQYPSVIQTGYPTSDNLILLLNMLEMYAFAVLRCLKHFLFVLLQTSYHDDNDKLLKIILLCLIYNVTIIYIFISISK